MYHYTIIFLKTNITLQTDDLRSYNLSIIFFPVLLVCLKKF